MVLIFFICISLTISLAASKPALLKKEEGRTYPVNAYTANQPLTVYINANGDSHAEEEHTDDGTSKFSASVAETENGQSVSGNDQGQNENSESSRSGGIHGLFNNIFQ